MAQEGVRPAAGTGVWGEHTHSGASVRVGGEQWDEMQRGWASHRGPQAENRRVLQWWWDSRIVTLENTACQVHKCSVNVHFSLWNKLIIILETCFHVERGLLVHDFHCGLWQEPIFRKCFSREWDFSLEDFPNPQWTCCRCWRAPLKCLNSETHHLEGKKKTCYVINASYTSLYII